MRGLYVHIPFCKNICSYCDFYKRILKNLDQENAYITDLIKELRGYKKYLNEDIVSIYIGGGTPNSLTDSSLERLLAEIDSYNHKNVEYSIEINPELLTARQVELFKKYKINRVSMGVQSFNAKHLSLLGRHHTKEIVIKAIKMLQDASIENINIDLMFGFFYQSLDDVKKDLEVFYALNIPHISYYSLILEEKTKLYLDYAKGKYPNLDEDLIANMFEYIIGDLKKHGYTHYEISNFCKDAKPSIHNMLYWQSKEYIGVGSGASGYLDHVRYTNDYNLDKYHNKFILQSEEISLEEAKKEFFLLGLRMTKGVSKNDYKDRFNVEMTDDFSFDSLIEKGLVEFDGEYLRLTPKGIMLGNLVFEEFV